MFILCIFIFTYSSSSSLSPSTSFLPQTSMNRRWSEQPSTVLWRSRAERYALSGLYEWSTQPCALISLSPATTCLHALISLHPHILWYMATVIVSIVASESMDLSASLSCVVSWERTAQPHCWRWWHSCVARGYPLHVTPRTNQCQALNRWFRLQCSRAGAESDEKDKVSGVCACEFGSDCECEWLSEWVSECVCVCVCTVLFIWRICLLCVNFIQIVTTYTRAACLLVS